MAVKSNPVDIINWLNWIGYQIVIKDDTEIIAGTLNYVRYQPNGGLFDLCIGSTVVRYNGPTVIQYATPADASQALYNEPLSPQT